MPELTEFARVRRGANWSLKAGPELDRLVAKLVLKWETWDSIFDVPSYSTDIAAAWEVVARVSKEFNLDFSIKMDAGGCLANFGPGAHSNANDVPLAICRAALRAVEEPAHA